MLKAKAWPLSDAAAHWQAEVRGLYADALYALPEKIDGQAPLPVPSECPVTLDELLTRGLDGE